jgi:hypothetical protein
MNEIRKMIDQISRMSNELLKMTESLYHADKISKIIDKILKNGRAL